MPKQLELTIPTPCHEDWDKMTTVEKGRFCGSCQKQVMDFTNMSDSQLVAFFRKESNGSVCGRFMPEQLDRAIDIPKKRIPWVKYFFQFTLPLFLASLKANAQGQVVVKRTETKANTVLQKCKVGELYKMGDVAPEVKKGEVFVQPNNISGSVVGVEGGPIPYASILIDGTSNGVMADSAGVFTIPVPGQKEPVTLVVSSVGYESKEIVWTEDNRKAGNSLVVQLTPKSNGEVIVQSYMTMGRLSILGGIGVRRVSKTTDLKLPVAIPSVNNNMKVYPNPIPSGSAINIKCEKMEEDYYVLTILTMSGQQVYRKEIWIDKEARVLNIPTPVIAPGMYLVVMTDKQSRKRYSEKVVVQE